MPDVNAQKIIFETQYYLKLIKIDLKIDLWFNRSLFDWSSFLSFCLRQDKGANVFYIYLSFILFSPILFSYPLYSLNICYFSDSPIVFFRNFHCYCVLQSNLSKSSAFFATVPKPPEISALLKRSSKSRELRSCILVAVSFVPLITVIQAALATHSFSICGFDYSHQI